MKYLIITLTLLTGCARPGMITIEVKGDVDHPVTESEIRRAWSIITDDPISDVHIVHTDREIPPGPEFGGFYYGDPFSVDIMYLRQVVGARLPILHELVHMRLMQTTGTADPIHILPMWDEIPSMHEKFYLGY